MAVFTGMVILGQLMGEAAGALFSLAITRFRKPLGFGGLYLAGMNHDFISNNMNDLFNVIRTII